MKPDTLLVRRIREEFEGIGGLRLNVDEASQFWALEAATCEAVLRELQADGFLERGPDERFWCIEC
jgi:hypothetical protein